MFIFGNDCGVVIQVYKIVKSYPNMHFKWVCFTVYER